MFKIFFKKKRWSVVNDNKAKVMISDYSSEMRPLELRFKLLKLAPLHDHQQGGLGRAATA